MKHWINIPTRELSTRSYDGMNSESLNAFLLEVEVLKQCYSNRNNIVR